MATERTISRLSRPLHLACVDWSNLKYRTTVTSCLVQGVYRLAVVTESEAKPWWEQYHFTLREKLIDVCDNSVYGGVFEYNHYNHDQHISSDPRPPRYVIAFRGTVLRSRTWFTDLRSDLRFALNILRDSTTFTHAMQATEKLVTAEQKNTYVWLAGHSLGAARALLLGKTMESKGFSLESYIFNPPISAFPLEQLIKWETLKDGIRLSKSFFKAKVATVFKDIPMPSPSGQGDDPAVNQAAWIPYLFVNKRDIFCSEYIGYFKNRTRMSEMGYSNVERIATENPLKSLFLNVGGSSSSSDFPAEPIHHLRSAYMIVNTSTSIGAAHGLQQWWDPSFACECVLYPSITET